MTQEKPENPEQQQEPVNTEAATEAEATEAGPEQQLEQARAEAAENLDKFLRAKAEAENVRRRSAEEANRVRKFAIEQFAGELLAVRDSLELASQVELGGDTGAAVKQMHEGVLLTLKQLDNVFEKSGISVVDPAGEKFNPELHQAMTLVETGDVEPNHVVSVMQKGYVLNDRLLRPAMVVVAKAPAAAEPDQADTSES